MPCSIELMSQNQPVIQQYFFSHNKSAATAETIGRTGLLFLFYAASTNGKSFLFQ
jgi:hypothetical protein